MHIIQAQKYDLTHVLHIVRVVAGSGCDNAKCVASLMMSVFCSSQILAASAAAAFNSAPAGWKDGAPFGLRRPIATGDADTNPTSLS